MKARPLGSSAGAGSMGHTPHLKFNPEDGEVMSEQSVWQKGQKKYQMHRRKRRITVLAATGGTSRGSHPHVPQYGYCGRPWEAVIKRTCHRWNKRWLS